MGQWYRQRMGKVLVVIVGALMVLVVAHRAASADSTTPPTLDKGRVVLLTGIMDRHTVPEVIRQMQALAEADRTKPIDLVISSPGGEIVSGFFLLSEIMSSRLQVSLSVASYPR